jgi:hypothetical protein
MGIPLFVSSGHSPDRINLENEGLFGMKIKAPTTGSTLRAASGATVTRDVGDK